MSWMDDGGFEVQRIRRECNRTLKEMEADK